MRRTRRRDRVADIRLSWLRSVGRRTDGRVGMFRGPGGRSDAGGASRRHCDADGGDQPECNPGQECAPDPKIGRTERFARMGVVVVAVVLAVVIEAVRLVLDVAGAMKRS